MWWFKRRKELIKKEVEMAVQDVLLNNTFQKDLSESFIKMNTDILSAFKNAQENIITNSTSISSLAQSIGHLLQALQTMEDRIKVLESLCLAKTLNNTRN